MPGIVLTCDTENCNGSYNGGNGLDKPGPYRPRGYLRMERPLMIKHAATMGWFCRDKPEVHLCPQCAIDLYNKIYKEQAEMCIVNHHHVPGSPMESIKIEASGEPGPGGAPNQYFITGMDFAKNPLFAGANDLAQAKMLEILFQHGNPAGGPNGITIETLMAICIHRLEEFQKGPYPHEKNVVAVDHLFKALDALRDREISYMKPDPVVADAVATLKGYYRVFADDTAKGINTGHISDEVEDMMERDIAHSDLSEIQKTEVMAALQHVAGKSLLTLKLVEQRPERVLDHAGTRAHPQWQEHEARFVPPEDIEIDVRVSADARQAGSNLVADIIASALRQKGYTNVTNMATVPYSQGDLVVIPENEVTEEQRVVQNYGTPQGLHVLDVLKKVHVNIIRDYDATEEKTRQ